MGAFARQHDPTVNRLIATNPAYVCYPVGNGHIRVIAVLIGKFALLKGHTGKVLDMELSETDSAGVTYLASVSTSGETIIWRLQRNGAELNAALDLKLLHTGFSHEQTPGHYGRVVWRKGVKRWPPALILLGATGVDQIDVNQARLSSTASVLDLSRYKTRDSDTAALIKQISAGSHHPRAAACSADGTLLAIVTNSKSSLELHHLSSDAPTSKLHPHDAATVDYVSFIPPLDTGLSSTDSRVPLAFLTAAKQHTEYKLWFAPSNPPLLLSTLTLSASATTPATFQHVELDPTGSFLFVTYHATEPTGREGEHGFLVIHLRRDTLSDVRFDYVSTFPTAHSIISFSLSNDPPIRSVGWDMHTVNHVQMYCCSTKPIVRYHLPADMCARHVHEHEFLSDQQPAQQEQQESRTEEEAIREEEEEKEREEAVTALLLTPDAIRAADMPQSPAQTPVQTQATANGTASTHTPPRVPSAERAMSTPLSVSSPPLSVTVTAASSHHPGLKILQRPPAINSAVLNTSAGSPSSSPTSSHQEAALFMSPLAAQSPEAPTTPAPSPAGDVHNALPRLPTATKGLLVGSALSPILDSPQSASAPAAEPAAAVQLAPPPSSSTTRPSHRTLSAPANLKQEQANTQGHSSIDSSPVTPETAVPTSTTITTTKKRHPTPSTSSADDAAPTTASDEPPVGRREKQEKQEAALLARLDKLFARHFSRVGALVSLNLDKVMTSLKEENDKERKDRVLMEKNRTEGLLRVMATSIHTQLEQMMEKTIGPAIQKSTIDHVLPQIIQRINEAIQTAVQQAASQAIASSRSSAPSLPPIDTDALSTSITSGLRTPLSDSFKQAFTSTLLPGFEASTRAMLKQIEAVNVKMSDKYESMMADKLDQALQLKQQQQQHELNELKGMMNTLISNNTTLTKLITTMQQQQLTHTNTIHELKAMIQTQQQLLQQQQQQLQQQHQQQQQQAVQRSAPGTPGTPVTPHSGTGASSAAASTVSDPKLDILSAVQHHQYEAAFTRALSLGKVPIVTWLCQQLDPRLLSQYRLSSAVLLSLIQQLGFNMREDGGVKLSWLRECVMLLDRNDASIAKHVPQVLRDVLQKVEEQLNQGGMWIDPAHPLHDQARTVKHLLSAMT